MFFLTAQTVGSLGKHEGRRQPNAPKVCLLLQGLWQLSCSPPQRHLLGAPCWSRLGTVAPNRLASVGSALQSRFFFMNHFIFLLHFISQRNALVLPHNIIFQFQMTSFIKAFLNKEVTN